MILFRGKLLRGNRSKKVDANGLDSFDSPNYEPLGICEINYQIKWEKLIKPDHKRKLKVQKTLCENIAIIKYHPLMSINVLESIFKNPETKGIILESYGLGNLPSNNKPLMDLIKTTNDRGVIILNLSQCFRYQVSAVYETGTVLQSLGVVNGGDMTVEAALTKMAYLLGVGYPTEEVKKLLVKNIRGEITPLSEDQFEAQEEDFIQAIADAIARKSNESNLQLLRSLILPNIVCYIAKYGFLTSLMELESYSTNFKGEFKSKRRGKNVAKKNK